MVRGIQEDPEVREEIHLEYMLQRSVAGVGGSEEGPKAVAVRDSYSFGPSTAVRCCSSFKEYNQRCIKDDLDTVLPPFFGIEFRIRGVSLLVAL